jgi:NADPH:quinone reductase
MRAIRIHSYGGPDVMQLEELPTPVPRSGEALVRIHAASVNFLDVQKRRGELVGQAFYHRVGGGEPDLPVTMGSQGVGVVEAIGPEVTNSKVGARVSFWGNSYATHVLVPAQRLVAIPEEITFEQAAAGMNQGFLAYVYTHFVYPIKPGAWRLVPDPGRCWRHWTVALPDGQGPARPRDWRYVKRRQSGLR